MKFNYNVAHVHYLMHAYWQPQKKCLNVPYVYMYYTILVIQKMKSQISIPQVGTEYYYSSKFFSVSNLLKYNSRLLIVWYTNVSWLVQASSTCTAASHFGLPSHLDDRPYRSSPLFPLCIPVPIYNVCRLLLFPWKPHSACVQFCRLYALRRSFTCHIKQLYLNDYTLSRLYFLHIVLWNVFAYLHIPKCKAECPIFMYIN